MLQRRSAAPAATTRSTRSMGTTPSWAAWVPTSLTAALAVIRSAMCPPMRRGTAAWRGPPRRAAGGAAVCDGGAGGGQISYVSSDAAVNVDLARTAQQGGHAEGDQLASILHIAGSDHAGGPGGRRG